MATGPGFQKIPNMYAECDFGRVKLIRDDDSIFCKVGMLAENMKYSQII